MIETLITTFGSYGYAWIFFLMALESSIFPVPSELVMIPAGILAARWDFSIWMLILIGGLGSLLGAFINYYLLGQIIGKPFLEKYGKYFFINHKKYLLAEELFDRNENLYTFLGRFIPVVRHLISIPAGIFRMNVSHFAVLTFIGASIWCAFLILLGYYLGQPVIDLVVKYSHIASILAVIWIGCLGIWFIRRK